MPGRNGILISTILAATSAAFAPPAMAQSRTDTAGLQATAQSQNSVTPARKPIAAIAGRVLYEDELLPLMEEQLQHLRNQEYELKSRALEKLIDQKLLEAAASRNGVAPDRLIEQEVLSKVPEPTDSEIQAFYLGQRERQPLEEVKARLREALKQAKIEQARLPYMEQLRRESNVNILLQPPKIEIGYDPSRVRGNPDAPITIVEFSDFECPFCRASEQTVKSLLSKYGDKVKVAYRDFPLTQNHSHAQVAAEASRCANEQGKFWEYHDLLFSGPIKLDSGGLLEQAKAVGLNETQFLSCLNTGKFKSAVDADVKAGSRARVSGTPAFFINGVFIGGAQPASVFEKTIDSELARLSSRSSHAAEGRD
jgi:protein-disulfide isomerase